MSNLQHEILSRNTLWNDNEGRLFMIRFCLGLMIEADMVRPSILEIGVDRGSTPIFLHSHLTRCGGYYVGVDPKQRVPFLRDMSAWWTTLIGSDSRSFWQGDIRKWDLIFVDGCHDDDVADLDVCEAIKRLTPNGILLVHDVRDDGGPRRAFVKHCVDNPHISSLLATAENVCGSGMGVAFRKGSIWE